MKSSEGGCIVYKIKTYSPSTFDRLIHFDVSHGELLLFSQILQKLDKVGSGHGNDRALVEPAKQKVRSIFSPLFLLSSLIEGLFKDTII